MKTNKCLFIDLDNTLYHYQTAHTPAEKELIKYLSKQYKISNFEAKIRYKKSRNKVKKYLGETAGSHSKLLYLSHFNLIEKDGINLEKILTGHNVYWNSFLNNMKLFDGVIDFLSTARHQGFKIILITDLTTEIQYRKIKSLEIENLIDILITSEDAGGDKSTGKPEKLLRDLYGDLAGICIGDRGSDHLFRDNTIFFKKISLTDKTLSKSERNFTNFKKLSEEIFG